ncbi:MAG: hypothetical protein CME32_07075 [Gimesia sp.]|uniref:Uncharacterized protein n=1 Tax=Gimesia chilikensis TaxID=2605989 RepID=A0A517PJF1_9PLAN|nr:hypothetical protein [Gimesia chilikensis]KAA0137686.1 hypothetical protein FYZ48_13465 [Gimesia chilikensis]MBN69019.1 hypothetical protein [Gimesia sp.]QDT19502.1 hypothetical protein HG66A1_12670 [Gimesia chilikensis]
MPAWPGGPCPRCGEDMPANLVHCQTCRELLNEDLEHDTVEIPAFHPLKELAVRIDAFPIGFYFQCPDCSKELRVHKKYLGKQVSCNFCQSTIQLPDESRSHVASAFYTKCPHCKEELRIARKYLGSVAACKFCKGHIQLLEKPADPVDS